jgi:probable HAF family extracellular repeat protein
MVVLAAVATATPASAVIVATDLGTLPGDTFSQASSVRDDGVAVGYSIEPSGRTRAVRFAVSGAITELATAGRNSNAHDINESGVVVGEAEPAGIERPFPVWWDTNGAITELPGFFSGSARSVNDAGVIVGVADNDGQWPLRWQNASTAASRLATLPGGEHDSAADDINNLGVVVGYSRGSDGVRHAVMWDATGAISQLDTPPGYPECFASELNDSGMIVGSCFAGSDRVAVRWDETGAAAILATLGPSYAEATGISDAGIVVGYAKDADGRVHAVRWGAFGTITRLATLGGVHGIATDINNTGTIVGRSNLATGEFHATSWRNAG